VVPAQLNKIAPAVDSEWTSDTQMTSPAASVAAAPVSVASASAQVVPSSASLPSVLRQNLLAN
jgi:hypothetical protein